MSNNAQRITLFGNTYLLNAHLYAWIQAQIQNQSLTALYWLYHEMLKNELEQYRIVDIETWRDK